MVGPAAPNLGLGRRSSKKAAHGQPPFSRSSRATTSVRRMLFPSRHGRAFAPPHPCTEHAIPTFLLSRLHLIHVCPCFARMAEMGADLLTSYMKSSRDRNFLRSLSFDSMYAQTRAFAVSVEGEPALLTHPMRLPAHVQKPSLAALRAIREPDGAMPSRPSGDRLLDRPGVWRCPPTRRPRCHVLKDLLDRLIRRDRRPF